MEVAQQRTITGAVALLPRGFAQNGDWLRVCVLSPPHLAPGSVGLLKNPCANLSGLMHFFIFRE